MTNSNNQISHVFVGSTNPVKINAVIIAASEHWPKIQVEGLSVSSKVSDQPISRQETKTGAINRAKAVFTQGLQSLKKLNKQVNKNKILGLGLEGGVITDDNGEMWSQVWGAVVDSEGQLFLASGAGFKIDPIVADKIRQGKEMGPVMSRLFAGRNIRQQEGLIGVITNKFVDRTEEYSAIAKLALGLWYGRDWKQSLPSTKIKS